MASDSRWDTVRRCRVTRPARSSRHSSEDRETAEIYGRSGVYAVSKRQLSAREIREFELRDGKR